MDITLGPWKAVHAENKDLAEAMGDEAWKIVEKAGFFKPKTRPKNALIAKGYSISGVVKSVVNHGHAIQVFTEYTVWIDSVFSTIPMVSGSATGQGTPTETIVRDITEARINKILGLIKSGAVSKVR